MTRRTPFRPVRIALIGIGVLFVGFFGLWFAAEAGSSSGSPELAEKWRKELDQFSDPDEAHAHDSRISVVRFDNGEWLFVKMQPSHGIWYRGGGTVVVKDCHGQVPAFFGHVCAETPHAIGYYETKSLDQFYGAMTRGIFREHHFP